MKTAVHREDTQQPLKPRVRYQHSETQKRNLIYFLSSDFLVIFLHLQAFRKKNTSRLELREITSPSDPNHFCSQRSSTHFILCLGQGGPGWLPYSSVPFTQVFAGLRLTHLHSCLPKPCALETAPS